MKIDYIKMDQPCRIFIGGGSSENSFFSSERWDILLVDYKYFEVRRKGDPRILAIIPFGKANYCFPAQQEATVELSSLEREEEVEAPLMEVVKRPVGRPRNDSKTFERGSSARS